MAKKRKTDRRKVLRAAGFVMWRVDLLDVVRVPIGYHDPTLEEVQVRVLLIGEVILPFTFRAKLTDVPNEAFRIHLWVRSFPDPDAISTWQYRCNAGLFDKRPHQPDKRDDFLDPSPVVVQEAFLRIPGFCSRWDRGFLFRLGIPEIETADLDE